VEARQFRLEFETISVAFDFAGMIQKGFTGFWKRFKSGLIPGFCFIV